MKRLPKRVVTLSRVYHLLGIVSVALKLTADYRRHAVCTAKAVKADKTPVHDQRCHCFQQCLPCLTAAAKG